MPAKPHKWKSAAAAKQRAEELRIAMDQFQRKEITVKRLVDILRPEIMERVLRTQEEKEAAGTPMPGTTEEQIEAFIKERLMKGAQIPTMLRICLNDAEQAAGMWDHKPKGKKR